MRRTALACAAGVASAAALAAGAAQGCEIPASFAPLGRVESANLVVAYKPAPAPIALGKHFALETIVCAKAGAAPKSVRVDAQMPEHRHGMNYKARVVAQGDGRWRAEGLLFHMPGRWQFVFDVETGKGRERLVHDFTLQ
jgi:hypothetical protein